MSKIDHESRKAARAVAMAAGRTVPGWAQADGVPERSARTWSNSPEVVAGVQAIRRRVVARTVGPRCGHAAVAVRVIGGDPGCGVGVHPASVCPRRPGGADTRAP